MKKGYFSEREPTVRAEAAPGDIVAMRERTEIEKSGAFADRGERRFDALIALAFGAIMLCIAGVVIFCYDSNNFCNKDYEGGFLIGMPPLAGIVWAALAVLVFCLRRRHWPRGVQSGALGAGWLAFAGTGLFALQLFIGYNTYAVQSGDVYYVVQSAFSLGRGEAEYVFAEYLETYPNNIPLVVLFSLVQRALLALGIEPGIERFTAILMVIQCAVSALTGVLWMHLTNRITGRRAPAWTVLALYTVLIGLSGWITVPYSDSMVIGIPVLTALWDLCSRQSERAGRRLGFAALAGAAGGMGMLIKPQGTMVFCAILFCEAAGWVFVKSRRTRASVGRFAVLICAFLLVYGPVRSAIFDMSGLNGHSERRVSPLHYIYMGLGEAMDGCYNEADHISADEVPDYGERQALYGEAIVRRLEDMGAQRLLDHLKKKTLVNFSDGTFAWGINGFEPSEPKNERISPFLRSVFWQEGRYHRLLSITQQGIWLLVLTLCPFAGLAGRRRAGRGAPADEMNVLLVSVLGFAAFAALFEAGGRYVFSTAPTMIMLAACVLCRMCRARGVPGEGSETDEAF